MGYVGNQQAEGFVQRPTKQDLTGATGTSLTLSHAVSKEEDIDLYINNVKQEPTTAYTVADTAVTLTGSVVATDDIYVVYNSLALQTVTPPDGSVTSAKLASGAVTSAKLDTNIAISGTLDVTGQITESGKEYFHVDLTTAQTGISDNTTVNVDFGGSGTVKYDTKSNFDSTNDAYLLDSSDGVYLISYSIGLRCENLGAEAIIAAASLLRVATDGSTFAPIQGAGAHVQDHLSDEIGSLTLSGTCMYKATTATTKIDLQGYINNSGTNTTDWVISDDINDIQAATITGGDTARCTFLSIVRIA